MDISNEAALSPNVPSEKEHAKINSSQWIDYRFLPTPGFDIDWSEGHRAIPEVDDWRFSPSGRTGVCIIADQETGGITLFWLDVYNKFWFGTTIMKNDVEYMSLFTYHMLTELSLVVIETPKDSVVKQHIFNVNLETRTAEFIHTSIHTFRYREASPVFFTNWLPPHLQITVNRNRIDGYHFDFTSHSSAGLLYFTTFKGFEDPTSISSVYFGLYLSVEIFTLIEIYNHPIEFVELDADQGTTSMNLVTYRFMKSALLPRCSIARGGSLVIFHPDPTTGTECSKYATCIELKSKRIFRVKHARQTYLNYHSCGAVLQFKMSPSNKRLFVRVASHWKNTLFSLISSKLIFNKNNQIDSIEGLYRIIFDQPPPRPLDETAKKALGTSFKEYKKMLTSLQINQSSRPTLDLEAMRMLVLLLFGVPFLIFAVIQLYLFMM